MKTIQVTLFMGEDQEILGDFASYEEALSLAQDALKEVAPGEKYVIGGHQKGSVSTLDMGAHQRIRVPGGDCSALLQVMEIEEAVTAQIDQTLEGVEDPSLIEEEPVALVTPDDGYHAKELVTPPKPKSKPESVSKPVVEPHFVPAIYEASEPAPEKKKKKVAKNPPAINVGEHKFWGCDQQKVLSFVEQNHATVLQDGLELRRYNGKWALVSGPRVIWTTGYEKVAGFALEMAKKHLEDFSALA